MSDEIDLNTNNICTTEDAFEQFQSVSMYEENEFIILSDIVSPRQAAADLAVDLSDIPYESEVVLETQYEEQVPEVNSTVESVSENNKNTEVPSPNPEISVSEDHQESTTVPQPSKRGRKKKNQQSESILTINQTHNEQSNGKQEMLMQDGKSTNYSHKSKRGRKPKKKDESFTDSHNNSELSIKTTEEVSTTKRTLQKRRSSLVATSSLKSTSINENSLVGKSSKKHGRAKKVPTDQQPQLLEEQNNEDCLEQNILETDSFNISENNGVSNNSSKRLRRKKASTELISPNEAEIDSVDSVSRLDQSGDQIEDESIKVPVKPIKSHGKRGRPRKIKPEDVSAIHLEKSKDSVEALSNNDDDAYDDICLSKLKKTIDPIEVTAKIEAMDVTADGLEQNETEEIEIESVETIKSPKKFEIHTGTKHELSVNESSESKQNEEAGLNEMQEDGYNSLLVEDTSKRPVRRKAKKTLQYDESSDEDPFANVELSEDDDDEPKRGKKGTKYYSDDEYIPGASKRGNISSSDVSDSDIDEEVDDLMIKQRRKKQKLDDTPRKRGRKPKLHNEEEPVMDKFEPEVETITPNVSDIQNDDDDVEICLQSSLIKPHDNTKQKAGWGTTDEFENFIAKRIHGTDIKIKKASTVQPLEIPMIEAKDVKKSLDKGSQTIQVKTSSVEAQTSAPYDLPMKDNVPLSSEQTEKACDFLKGIVKTTAELGELMTQKSEDFINKKINTSHITDTFKMDYCVRKSFLLFKLAKHNLMQMEEDLSNQYNEFLSSNNLMKHREAPKVLSVAAKSAESDSDCEIIEGPPTVSKNLKKDKEKPKFNPKTVFLNKELSIKIAKKPSEDKKLNIKSRHTVWINDSVMVKKVKPTQSFLAQDSRNKKPPDGVTIEMVNEFFKEYYRQQALLTCAPFVTTEWISFNKKYVCSYFTKPDEFSTSSLVEIPSSSELVTTPVTGVITKSRKHFDVQHKLCSPKTLFSLCSQALLNYLNNSFSNLNEKPISICNALNKRNPQTLYCLCINKLNLSFYNIPSGNKQTTLDCAISTNAMPLKTLCFRKIHEILDTTETETMTRNLVQFNHYEEFYVNDDKQSETSENSCDVPTKHLRSLFSLCVSCLQSQLLPEHVNNKSVSYKNNFKEILQQTPKTLKYISYKNIEKLLQIKTTVPRMPIDHIHKVKTLSDLCFKIVTKTFTSIENETPKECLTINSVNTLTEEAYLNIEQSTELTDNLEYYADDDTHFYEDETEEGNFDEINNTEDNNWISQLEMKELRSIPNKLTDTEKHVDARNPLDQGTLVTRIKLEPEEEPEPIVENSIVKIEPLHNLDEMTIIPESIITKSELIDQVAKDHIQRKDSSSYDVESFEAFVRSNKMIHALNEQNDFEEIFSQSASRIRRQYEPDSDTENDISMDLLVPQTFEPIHIDNAKDVLMESSGDESSNTKKPINKKKLDKRRTKTKKMDPKSDKTKDISKDKPPTTNEVAVLTRRMREKIRQEEKKIATSDSESEICTLGSPKDKENENVALKKTKESIKEYSKTKAKISKSIDDEIQCNNVDSTERFVESSAKCESPDPSITKFTGFSAVDQNEGHNYQKYVKYVYDKILPQPENEPQTDADAKKETAICSVINPDEPVELLECEPTMPIFDNEETVNNLDKQIPKNKIKKSAVHANSLPYKERHGWKCYPLDSNDTKLYQDAQIVLEKLPESFVETYFMYQNISDKNKEDIEVDRLTNLQSLNRLIAIAKEGKSKSKSKSKPHDPTASKTASDENHTDSRTVSANSDYYDELSPSEDENVNVDDKPPSPTKKNNFSDNTIAKSSLMDDQVSDDETEDKVKVKKESEDPNAVDLKPVKKSKPGPKSKCKPIEPVDPESLMLTADKMMNKELNLLHAPIVLDGDVKPTLSKGPVTRNRQKCSTKLASDSKRVKADDDSSSEEEKQWFTIKEKLLKKMINKKDTTREDDAKRAKLVSEFIERRGDLAESFSKRRLGRGRRSKKRMLERQKQLRILSRELFGDPSNDASHQGKTRYNQAYSKGRKNIRKVIDKKSLAKNTVIANMEEFERKRQLNIRQTKLREIMQCEEGVNVLVINDEVCLEYDFDNHRPVVTIHSFFTKVMKAHQYEGVKFMWDACFESLEDIAAGHRGGGCILAHCMGLGKTLQVLALLHTVLTHPRVGMQRVLVCCPLSTVLNWVDEIHKWIGPVTAQIKVFELSKLKKTYERAYQLEDWYNGGGIFIIGYELFRSLTTLDPYLDDVRPTIVNKIRNALLDPGPDIIICDEGHLLKNDCSVLAVAMSRVVTKRRIVLTGTPMQNNLREYYCMVNFVKPNLLGTYAEYSNRFENPIMNGQHRDSREEDIKLMKARTHILHKVLEGCLQRQEASVLYPYLPKKFEYTVFVSLTKCQWDLYKHYLQNCTSNLTSKNNVLKDFHILQKIWSHPQVLHNFQMRSRDDTKSKVKLEKLEDDLAREDLNADLNPAEDIKLDALTDTWWLQYLEGGEMLESLHSSNKFVCVFRILDECIELGDKLLIFSTSLFTMDALEYFLKKNNKWSLGKEYFRLDGSVPAEVRQKWCREFNAEHNVNTKLFLISTRAGCLGLNMTAANRVIILDTSWNPAHDIQSIFRVYRFGQKKDCYIYRLVAMGTMEQKIYERSVTKQAVACRVVDEQQIDRHYNMADLTELYRYDESGVGVAGGVAVGVQDVALLRVARDANLHAVHEHDSLLRGSGEQGLPEHERNAAWVQFQQEHANKQMQNDLETENSKLPINQVHGHDYAKSPSKQTVVKTEADAPATDTKPKRGKEKKSSVVSCYIPIQPQSPGESKDLTTDQNKEEEIVRKIADILIKHNFNAKQEPRDIAALVDNVRKIVATGRIVDIAKTDKLTYSIANVLLAKDLPLPEITNIMCESVNNTLSQPSTSTSKEEKPKVARKKGKKRFGYVYEEIKPVESPKVEELQSDGRRRRRAAIAAERNFDTVADSIIDMDNYGSDAEFIPDKAVSVPVHDARVSTGESHTEVKQEPAEDIYDKPILFRKETKATPPMSKTKKVSKYIDTQTTNLHENSILLSDDEEPPPPPKKKPGPARKTLRVTETRETTKQVKPEVPEESDDIVPLHPSLLSNQNFIKIVAHTYLTGNPMLDEDAATLAAQYSTQKALKEYEATGNDIKTGPLHDIAIQVLGEEILKKLHVTKGKAPCKAPQQAEPPPEVIKEKTPEPTPPPEPKRKPLRLKIRLPETKRRSSGTPVTSTYVPPTMTSSFVTPAVTSTYVPPTMTSSFVTPAVTSSYVTPDAAPPFVSPAVTSAKVVPVGFFRLGVAPPRRRSHHSPWTHVDFNRCLVGVEDTHGWRAVNPFMGASELTTSNVNQSADECILPDDDDIRIITDSPPTTLYQVPPTPYQAPATLYQAPATPYQAPATPYQAPATPYQAPATPYQAPATPYQAPATSYQAPTTSYQVPATSYQAPINPNQTLSTSYQASTPLYQTPSTSYQPPTKPDAIAPKTLSRRNSSQLNLNNVLSKGIQPKGREESFRVTGSIRLPATSSQTVIQPIMVPMISANKILLKPEKGNFASQPVPVASTAVMASEQILSDLNNTISLDSDDEDDLPIVQIPNASNARVHTRTLTTHTQPVPVSLTAAVTQIPTFTHSISSTSATGMATTALVQTPLGSNKKYFILPSTHINKLTKVTEIPASAVPIQFNRGSMLSNNVPTLLKPASEVLSQNASDVTESILPVTSTEASNSCKRVCKPGDILRITKSGQIEVLNRKDKATPAVAEGDQEKPPSAAAPASSTNVPLPFTIDLDDTPAAPREIQTRNKNKKTESSGKPSNSTGSRSNSPFDPLSILRDVVHIEADDYGTQQSSKLNKTNTKETLVKSKPAASTKAVSNLSGQKFDLTKSTQNQSIAESTKSKQNQPKAEGTWHKVLSHKEIGPKTSQPPNFQPNLNKVSPVLKPYLEKKAMTNARNAVADSKKRIELISDKTNVTVIDIRSSNERPRSSVDRTKEKQSSPIIDITSDFQRPSGSADKAKEKQTKSRLGSTITGVSKDIIISGTGKAIKKVQAAPTQPIKTEKAKGLDSKKRLPTSTETSSAKKKKTDKLMTLKDFDIDDIDDIIELD